MAGRLVVMLLAVLTFTTRAIGAQEVAPQWIVVTAPMFEAALAPLCEYRRAEGMRVIVVRTTDVLSAEQIRGGDSTLLKEHINKLCRQAKAVSYVLLVGAAVVNARADAVKTAVPALRGTVGRMKGAPSDNGYGCLDDTLMPTVAVGRFPARSKEEVRQMVQKTLAFERDRSAGLWRNRMTLLAGNPGGSTAIEKQFADLFVQSVAKSRFEQLDPSWTARIMIHAKKSPFCVPDDRLRQVALRYIQAGQVFSFYLGHSNASGLWSQGAYFLDREDWARMKITSGPGVFFTCGCFSCQLGGPDGEGYGLTAMRNPDGPVAVIGAHGLTYAAMGQLALDGILECLNTPAPPARVADYWLATKAGLAHGKMDPLIFWLYDQADGSQGKVPLDEQRLEHLEMWMLLGDPALKLPVRPATIRMKTAETPLPGAAITVRGTLPAQFAETSMRLTLERPLGSTPIGLEALPNDPASAGDAMMANHERSNSVVLATYEVKAHAGRFEYTLTLPMKLPWSRLTVRAFVATHTEAALGVLSLPLSK